MSLSRYATGLWVLLAISAFGATSCAEAKKVDRVSLLPTLAAMRPIIMCLTKASPGDQRAAEDCATAGGIVLTPSTSEPPTINDLRAQLVGMWLYLDRNPARRISVADFDQALDFARCIKSAAFADPSFSSRTERGVAVARLRADAACREHPLSIKHLSPEVVASGKPIENAVQIMLARALSGFAVKYALEANGLITDAMRPCVRYLDGRPPSRGCKGKSQGRIYPPPPAPPSITNDSGR